MILQWHFPRGTVEHEARQNIVQNRFRPVVHVVVAGDVRHFAVWKVRLFYVGSFLCWFCSFCVGLFCVGSFFVGSFFDLWIFFYVGPFFNFWIILDFVYVWVVSMLVFVMRIYILDLFSGASCFGT